MNICTPYGAVGAVDAEGLARAAGSPRARCSACAKSPRQNARALRQAAGEVGVTGLPEALGRPVQVGRRLGQVVRSPAR